MEVKVAQSQEVLTDVQLMARAAGVPTHTYAGKGPGHGKHRSVIAVGPAEKATLHRIVGRLEEM